MPIFINENLNPAPILIFTYKRIDSLKKVIESLHKNSPIYRQELYIFSDGPKNEKDKSQVIKLRKYLLKIKGFKKIIIIKRKKNFGLALSIINGVSKIIKFKKKAIIIEDDVVVGKHFLKFMNFNLNKYKNEKKIWHVSGWNWNFRFPKYKYDVFFIRYATCWGWATWENRWKYFEKDSKKLIQSFNKNKIRKFNLENHYNFWSQIIRNENRIINTWAIFWYATIFNNKGLSINPLYSMVKNIGNDNYSTNYKKNIFFKNKLFENHDPTKYPKKIKEDEFILKIIKANLKPNFFKKFFYKIFN